MKASSVGGMAEPRASSQRKNSKSKSGFATKDTDGKSICDTRLQKVFSTDVEEKDSLDTSWQLSETSWKIVHLK